MCERWTPRRVCEAQRAAILAGVPYRGPSLYDISDPAWHEIEVADDDDRQRLNGEPSHFDTCDRCTRDDA